MNKSAFVLVLASCAVAAGAEPYRHISGIYPDLTTYTLREDVPFKGGNECGIGGIVPWASKLYMINYGAHYPNGSTHSLYGVGEDLDMKIHPLSVGGTPAGRMIHRESEQLLIGPYLIDKAGKVRVITPKVMPSRITAIARHLEDPANMVYYFDMEGTLYEANVNTLAVKKLFHDAVPGTHGKGGYTGQGRLVISNNGKSNGHDKPSEWQVDAVKQSGEDVGTLAEWDGHQWRIVEQRQYTDITGPGGIYGAPDNKSPLWTIGWDTRSLRLKLLDGGRWHTFLLPKAAHNNDPAHGCFTEWPRIREITGGRWMMDMHGMFFDFPKTFSKDNTAGISPISSHIRYVPDFCEWNGKLVIATDETSIQGNKMAGQPQCNLWFGDYDDLQDWGPATGYGGPWVMDDVKAGQMSDPFLVNGFDRRILHLALGIGKDASSKDDATDATRCTGQFPLSDIPYAISELPRVMIRRGDVHKPAPGYRFEVDQDVTVFLAVDRRGDPHPGEGWEKTNMTLKWWNGRYSDVVYQQSFGKGLVEIPPNTCAHVPGDYGIPHTAFVKPAIEGRSPLVITGLTEGLGGQVVVPQRQEAAATQDSTRNVEVTLEVDKSGKGQWEEYKTVSVEDYSYEIFPDDFDAQWLRIKSSDRCTLTAYLHQTDKDHHTHDSDLFQGLAHIDAGNVSSAVVYAAKRNRNLRVIAGEKYFDFTKEDFVFEQDVEDPKLKSLLTVKPVFSVDAASVIVKSHGKTLRLPKGDPIYDKPFAEGWPRAVRELESERELANIHGTFYEVPLLTIGGAAHFKELRPVASHKKQITDFATWNGLLVLAGVDLDAEADEHVYKSKAGDAALWFGGIDDLWKLGKPVGTGGPWKDTAVKAGEPSDPYLMTGYDRKTVEIAADKDANITLEVDIDHQTGFHKYRTFKVKAGETVKHQFETGYSAHWVRAVADRDCKVTVWFEYR